MKLLLTSTGLTHQEIASQFQLMCYKNLAEVKVAFVTSAAVTQDEKINVEKSYRELLDSGISPENITTLYTSEDLSRFSSMNRPDVVYICGGNTFHLLNEVRKTGFDKKLVPLVSENVLYVGVSAGTIIPTPSISIASEEPADENIDNVTDFAGLNIVDFEISPHSPEIVSMETVESYARKNKILVYAISDKTGLKVVDNEVEVIGERKYQVFDFRV